MGYSINTHDNLLYYSFANQDGNPYPRALNAPSPGWIIRVRDRIYIDTG